MSWRTVVISNRAKLELKLGYLVVRGQEVNKIHLSEIAVLMIESTAVSLTASLVIELVKNNIQIVFCDEKHNPIADINSLYGSHDTSLKIRQQSSWPNTIKREVWTEIVKDKLIKQKNYLSHLGFDKESALVEGYIHQLEPNDKTNREAHAAKVYFNALFGLSFSRIEDCILNAGLNYGYAILLSAFNREIVSNGYITQLGIFHHNRFNDFNLGSDLMEPYRVLVDRYVYEANHFEFGKYERIELVNLLHSKVKIDGKKQTILNAIGIYTKSVFDALFNRDVSLLRFYDDEL